MMYANLPNRLALAACALVLAACGSHTAQGVRQDAVIVKDKVAETADTVVDKTVEGGKAVGRAVGTGLEKAGTAIRRATD
jgi:predicted small secreted protein